jgi:hypothetical protein
VVLQSSERLHHVPDYLGHHTFNISDGVKEISTATKTEALWHTSWGYFFLLFLAVDER